MQQFAKKKSMEVKKTESLFDQPINNSQTMVYQEARAEELKKQLSLVSDQNQINKLKKEIFEIEKYCQAVNILICGGV